MADVWAFFQNYGTGGLSSAAWIRPGSVDSVGNFTWLHEGILFPDNVWTYRPDYTGTGYLAVDPNDPDYIWVAACVDLGGINLYTRCYTYQVSTETWTLLLDIPFVGPSTPFPVDMCFDTDGTAFLAVGGNGAFGLAGGSGEGGVYKSVARSSFSSAGSGHEHGFLSGNINNPASLTALHIAPTTDDGTRVLYTAHTLTRLNIFQHTGWVTSFSDDDGTTWHDPDLEYNGNQFQLECLTRMLIGPYGSGMWYCADHSGTGAYSTANLSAVMDATPGDGPIGGYGGGIFDSGSIAHPFRSDSVRAVAFPTQISTTLYLYSTGDSGANWTQQSQGLEHAAFAYRGARTSETSLFAAGVSLDNADHASEIFWTPDGGATWYSALAEASAIGLSLDFGPYSPGPGMAWEEVLTYRDYRQYVGRSTYYVSAPNPLAARTQALALADLLIACSTGTFVQAVGPYTNPPTMPLPGSGDQYNNAEMVLRFTWLTDENIAIGIDIPCPDSALFLSDQESVTLLNPAVTDLIAGAITQKLCTRGGQLATQFIGARRIMRGFRSTQTIRILDVLGTSTGE